MQFASGRSVCTWVFGARKLVRFTGKECAALQQPGVTGELWACPRPPPQVNPPASTGQAASRALCGTVSAHCAMRHVAPRGAIKRQVATCPVLLSSPVTCWMPSLSRPVCVCVCVCVLCCVVINALCSPSAWDKNRQEFSFCVSCSFPSNCLSASPVGSLFV